MKFLIDGKPVTPDNLKGITFEAGGYIEMRDENGNVTRIENPQQKSNSEDRKDEKK